MIMIFQNNLIIMTMDNRQWIDGFLFWNHAILKKDHFMQGKDSAMKEEQKNG